MARINANAIIYFFSSRLYMGHTTQVRLEKLKCLIHYFSRIFDDSKFYKLYHWPFTLKVPSKFAADNILILFFFFFFFRENKTSDLEKQENCHNFLVRKEHYQGPVVQSVVSLMSSLRVISLIVLADSIYNILIFFAEKMWVAFALQKLLTFFQQKISAYLRITQYKF